MPTEQSMPRYRCHKEVSALKILGVRAERYLEFEPPFSDIDIGNQWVEHHGPQAGGYLVVYEDGYQSFSPAKAFEDGYTLVSR